MIKKKKPEVMSNELNKLKIGAKHELNLQM